MAYATINLKHPLTGAFRSAPVGFSWTTFFFGFFPALFRGHWAGAIIMFLLAMVTLGFSNLVFMFIYNKMYIKYLIGDGFKVESASQDLKFISGKLGFSLPMLEI